jgi:hypothetical protein
MEDLAAAVIAAAEEHLRTCLLAAQLPSPYDCLACYLHRALNGSECDGKLSLTHAWQGQQRMRYRRTGGFTAFLRSRGGCCDCKVLMNVYPDRQPDVGPRRGPCPHPAVALTPWSPL